MRQVAADLDIPEKRLHIWRAEMRAARKNGTKFAPGNGRVRDEELERLRKENQLLRLEREILKKAMAFLVPRPS